MTAVRWSVLLGAALGFATLLTPQDSQAGPAYRETVLTIRGREQTLRLPPGFKINVYSRDIEGLRFMAFSPEGELYAAMMGPGKIIRLPDADGDGVADRQLVAADSLNKPHSIAFGNGAMYVAEIDRLSRLQDPGRDGYYEIRDGLASLPRGGAHVTRTVQMGPDGLLYVATGASCNVCIEKDERRAAIIQFSPDGSGGRVFARGLRNAVGFVFHPTTGELWATNNGRDNLGDEYPPDTVNLVGDGDDFGWPRCINGRDPDPEFGSPGACEGVAAPAIEFQPHSAPLGLAFYNGERFPQEYRGDLFVAYHGSWNRAERTGYKVVRMPMRDGRLTGEIIDFVTGWIDSKPAWGRPVDIRISPNGDMYVSDDQDGVIYRISYGD
ncbi:MAG: PQQ-dependent sugar dehydrogenase [Chloroflexota bacterium]